MDKASIIAINEVCKRCPLYVKRYGMHTIHCGMSKNPSQCVDSGHFIDGYRKAEKDCAITWKDVQAIFRIADNYESELNRPKYLTQEYCNEVLHRFNQIKEKEK